MNFTRILIMGLVQAVLSGCSIGSKSEPPRQLHVTLLGGSRVNVGADGEPRPIQTCLYIVNAVDWVPMASEDSSCVGRDQDGTVIAVSRHVIAPNQVLQLWIDVPRSGEIWLVADADYARRSAKYVPMRMQVDGSGVTHLTVRLDRNGIYDASRQGSGAFGTPAGNIASADGTTDKSALRRYPSTRKIRQ
ncbi:Type VI secretion lipofamily protein [Burkholderia cepacia]|uniref:type VI secretion lipoprotein TssJ n=1 Tax=Burkholderia cepacia TaxID=292 RepID=UPI001CB42463|nr:type VI secretion lipoprotein TssJ [Burkholderia cepacia]CAG9269910.1 Type VI secretion lipofamily protein [Burkholderia cepacia]